MSKNLPKIVPVGSGTFDSEFNYFLQEQGIDVFEFYKNLSTNGMKMSNTDPDVVYLGHSTIPRKEFEQMNNSNTIISPPWEWNPLYPGYPTHDHTSIQLRDAANVIKRVQNEKWTPIKTPTHLILSLDLPGVKDFKLYVEKYQICVSAKRFDNNFDVYECFSFADYDVDMKDDITAKFEACVLSVSLPLKHGNQTRQYIEVIKKE